MSDTNEVTAEGAVRLTLEFRGSGLTPAMLGDFYAKVGDLGRSHITESRISASFLFWPNIYCAGISAQKGIGGFEPVAFHVVDGEAHGIWTVVQPGQTVPFDALLGEAVYPWCNSWAEMQKKAYRVYNNQTGQLLGYIYQNYSNNVVEYTNAWAPEPPSDYGETGVFISPVNGCSY